jgi:hypothetical protein
MTATAAPAPRLVRRPGRGARPGPHRRPWPRSAPALVRGSPRSGSRSGSRRWSRSSASPSRAARPCWPSWTGSVRTC